MGCGGGVGAVGAREAGTVRGSEEVDFAEEGAEGGA